MDREREYELQVILPYRKGLKAGDIFAMKFDDDFFVHGRVIRVDAYWTPSGESAGLANLIYTYKQIAHSAYGYSTENMTVNDLLIPPVMTNRLGWSRGYFHTVANVPFTQDDVLPRHVFEKGGSRNQFFDDSGQEVDGWDGPIGMYGLASFRAIQQMTLDALGLKCICG